MAEAGEIDVVVSQLGEVRLERDVPLAEGLDESLTGLNRFIVKTPVYQLACLLELFRGKVLTVAGVVEAPLADRYRPLDEGVSELVTVILKLEVENIEVGSCVLRADHRDPPVIVVGDFVNMPSNYSVNSAFGQPVDEVGKFILIASRVIAFTRAVLVLEVGRTPST